MPMPMRSRRARDSNRDDIDDDDDAAVVAGMIRRRGFLFSFLEFGRRGGDNHQMTPAAPLILNVTPFVLGMVRL